MNTILQNSVLTLSCVAVMGMMPLGIARGQGAPPPALPAAAATDWDAKAKAIVAQMTLDEKIAQLHGVNTGGVNRIVPGLPRLGIPALTVANGPAGLGPAGPGHEGKATALQAPISLAATWDVEASRLHGDVAGSDAVATGNLLLESPDINMARTPHNGRTFEGFGEDPYLAGRLAIANVEGIQAHHVVANVKHYAGNNQELNRQTINDVIDERTLREIYLPAFEAAIREGHCGSLMGAYNKVNGPYCCENDVLMNQILKGDWGFDGFVTSDFGAVHSTVPTVKAGLDLEMPNDKYWGAPLKQAVTAGEVPVALLDEKLVRRFRTMMKLGAWEDRPARPGIAPENAVTAKKIAEEGIVLLKNEGGMLPLKAGAIKSVAVIGPTAFAANAMTGGGGSSKVNPILTVKPVEGLQAVAGKDVTITLNDGTDVAAAVAAAKGADVAILMLGDQQTEGRDHSISLSGNPGTGANAAALANQDAVAAAVLAANPRTIVVLKSGGPVLMPWLEQAKAVVEAWYPGEEDGAAVAEVLFGVVNPSGKLPITFPKQDADLPTNTPAQYPGVGGQAQYSEGLLMGYRWYDAKKIEPMFAFGYGLSYTTFGYKDMKVSAPTADHKVTVEFTVTNTGGTAGAEVPQVYVSMPSLPDVPQPPRQLKGFKRVELAAGAAAAVSITLDARAFSYWDVKTHGWQVAAGTYTVSAAASSRDIKLNQVIEMK